MTRHTPITARAPAEASTPKSLPQPKPPTPPPPLVDVLVVGAGLSGLRAALTLHTANHTVHVLEARPRVGGKTLSLPASPFGGKVDVGAAWINDTSQSEMYSLARQFGFDLVQQRAEGMNLYQMQDGEVKARPHGWPEPFEPDEWEVLQGWFEILGRRIASHDLERPWEGKGARELDGMTFREFAEKEGGGGVAVKVADVLAASLLGVEAEEVSALFMVDYLKSGTGLENMSSDVRDGGQYLRNRQGNQTFSTRLASLLPKNSLHLSTPVTRITQSPGGPCIISTTNPDLTFHAKRVIVSVPTPFYPTITFTPPLPPAKRRLAETTALGYYAKTIFVFARPWWREAGLSGRMESFDGPISFTRDTCVPEDGQYSITCFIVGDRGRRWSKWSAAERSREVTAQFDAVFVEAAKEKGIAVTPPVNVIEKEWMKDPWAGGAPSPVMMPGVLTSECGRVLRERVGRVHFVGTETAVVWKGYMEGAVRSGIRGAEEVIEALSGELG